MKNVFDQLYSETRTRRNLWQISFPPVLDNCGVTFILSINFHQISSFYNTIEVKTSDLFLEFVQSLFLNTDNRTNRTCPSSCLCTSWGSRISSHLQTACRRWSEIKGWSGTVKKPCDTAGNGKYGLAPCKGIRIPESGNFLLVESGILGFGIPESSTRNPESY